MVIVDIIPITKQKYKITTDEQLAFVLYKGELYHYQLKVESEITDAVWEEIRLLLHKRAKLRAMHLLTKMDYTEMELRQKLLQGGYIESAVTSAIDYVKSYHYIDDERYVKKYMQQPSNKSQRQKEFELEKKGIPRDLIRQCKEALEEELLSELQSELQSEDNERATGKKQGETDLIQNLLEKRCKNPETADQKEKMKHYAYLARKGFRTEDILNVFDTFFVQN